MNRADDKLTVHAAISRLLSTQTFDHDAAETIITFGIMILPQKVLSVSRREIDSDSNTGAVTSIHETEFGIEHSRLGYYRIHKEQDGRLHIEQLGLRDGRLTDNITYCLEYDVSSRQPTFFGKRNDQLWFSCKFFKRIDVYWKRYDPLFGTSPAKGGIHFTLS
jgi:hypothetical protein